MTKNDHRLSLEELHKFGNILMSVAAQQLKLHYDSVDKCKSPQDKVLSVDMFRAITEAVKVSTNVKALTLGVVENQTMEFRRLLDPELVKTMEENEPRNFLGFDEETSMGRVLFDIEFEDDVEPTFENASIMLREIADNLDKKFVNP